MFKLDRATHTSKTVKIRGQIYSVGSGLPGRYYHLSLCVMSFHSFGDGDGEKQKTSLNKLRKPQSAAMDYSLVLFSLIYIIKEAFFQLQLPILWPYAHLWFPLPYFPSFGFWVSKVCRHACSSSDETDITIHGLFIAFSKGEMDWGCSSTANLQNAKEILWMDGDVALLLYLHLTRKQGKNPPSIGIISIFEILDEKESIRPEKMRVHCIAW